MKESGIQGIVVRVSACILLFIALFAARPLILGSGQQVKLVDAPKLAGQISQSMAVNDSGALPQVNKDYKIAKAEYFDNNSWVVVNFSWLDDTGNDGVLVLKDMNGVYNPVLGPGSAFSSTATETLPKDVSLYLDKMGVFYVPTE
jgi:hypothetical protein